MDLLDQDLDAISLELGEDEPTARLGRLKVRLPRPSVPPQFVQRSPLVSARSP